MEVRTRLARLGTAATVLGVLACSACEVGPASSSGPSLSTAATGGQGQLGITKIAQLPDPCKLVPTASIGKLIQAAVKPVPGEPHSENGAELLFRTCTWGDTNLPAGAIGIQIGVPDKTGHDVVANRSLAMDPALDTSVGNRGKETMNLGELPTGGGKGATIFFHHGGYSVMIGHVGPGASLGSVEDLATVVIAELGS